MFNQDVIAAVKAAKYCRVAVYHAVRGGRRACVAEDGRRYRRVWAHRLPARGRVLIGYRHDA